MRSVLVGLPLMMAFTLLWALIAENALNGLGHHVIGLLFLVAVVLLAAAYFKFYTFSRQHPAPADTPESPEEQRRQKQYLLVCGLEGLAIFVVKNVLVNLHHSELFIPALALIVGLHFFPLGLIFQRKFDFYMGAWTSAVAIAGLYAQHTHLLAGSIPVDAWVAVGCGLATCSYGFRMVATGRGLIRDAKLQPA